LSKGIRVNQLAKELGVESKEILSKCRDEGLGEKVPNHMSVLSVGLAETVREWFSGGGGTAVQTAPPVETKTKPKAVRKTTKKNAAGEDEPVNGNGVSDTPHDEPSKAEVPAETVVEKAPAPAPVAPLEESPKAKPVAEAAPVEPVAPVAAAAPASVAAGATTTTTAPVPAPTAPVMEQPVVAPPAPVAPVPAVAETPAVKPVPKRPASAPPIPTHPITPPPAAATPGAPGPRKTITLADMRPPQHVPERKVITPAPKLLVPKPATIQGPNIVREEAPDHVAPLRNKNAPRPGGPGQTDSPSFVQARARGGGGVVRVEEDEEEAKKKAAAAKKGSLSTRRRGLDGRRGEATEKLREFTEADLIARRDAINAATSTRAGIDRHLKQVSGRGQHAIAKTTVQKGEPIQIEEPITVRTLAAAMGIKTNDIISKLMKKGQMLTINATMETSIAETLALEYGLELRIVQQATMEEVLMAEFEAREVDPANLMLRPPRLRCWTRSETPTLPPVKPVGSPSTLPHGWSPSVKVMPPAG
jgi:translation initiation factor IF-2